MPAFEFFGRRRVRRVLHWFPALFLAGFGLWLPAIHAAQITQCTEAALRLAIREGGTVTFACNNTITLNATITITNNVTLEGPTNQNQLMTLSGGNSVRLFNVSTGTSLTLKNLILAGGNHTGGDGTNGLAAGTAGGGAVFIEGGSLAAVNCTFTGHTAAGGSGAIGVVRLNGGGGGGGHGAFAGGGAIYNEGGTVTLTNCAFTANSATAGNGGDGADGSSAGSNDGGDGGDGGLAGGGAIFNAPPGILIVSDCTFTSNRVTGGTAGVGGFGSGLGANGSNGLPGPGHSGAIYNDGGTVAVTFSTFAHNSAEATAGGDGTDGAVSENGHGGTRGADASGGAILNDGGNVTLTNCTFFANSVTAGDGGSGGDGGASGFGGDGGNGGAGGDGLGGGVCNDGGTSIAVNCTFSSNGALGGFGGEGGAAGGAFADDGQEGAFGGDNGGSVANRAGTFILKNTIVAYNASGGEGFGSILDGGNNICFDESIGFTQTTSYQPRDPQLGTLSSNGGPTQTIPLLVITNVAVNGGDDTACLPADQRHFARSGPCDIGAFEFGAFDPATSLNIRLQANDVVVSWTTAATNYALQTKPNLLSTNWVNVTNTAGIFEGQYVVTNSTADPSRFYRLVR